MDAGDRSSFALLPSDFVARARAGDWPAFRAGARDLSPEAEAFLQAWCADAAQDALGVASIDDLLAITHGFWAWALEAPSQRRVRLNGADGLARLEVAGPDMPFLVDSLMGELAEQGVVSIAMAHPIVQLAGAGPCSLIQVLIEPLSAERQEPLLEGVRATLADVASAVSDFKLLRARMIAAAAELETAAPRVNSPDVDESVAFLRWLAEDHFTFLGARDYRFPRDAAGEYIQDEPTILEETGLGILRDPARYVLRRGSEPSLLTPGVRRFLDDPAPIVVAKSSFVSRVHRRTQADYVGVKRYGPGGEPAGETRFVGLFTADAYSEPTRSIPMLRAKIQRVKARAGLPAGGHSAKALANLLETFPRDELFQTDETDLLNTGLAILHLLDRPRPRLFVRRDRFNRYVTAIAYVPKDRFNTALRAAIGHRLCEAFGGHVAAFYPELDDAPLARVRFIIQDIDRDRPAPDLEALDRDVAELTRTWEDAFEALARVEERHSPEQRAAMARGFRDAFTAGYRERNSPADAVFDATQIMAFSADEAVRVRAIQRAGEPAQQFTCKIYVRGAPLALSAVLPLLENMGLFVEFEVAAPVRPLGEGEAFHIHEVVARGAQGRAIDFAAAAADFEEAFAAILAGKAENDGFNRLILALGVGWRDAALIRALARFRTQTGLDPSQTLQEQALSDHPEIARLILGLFRVRHDPSLHEGLPERVSWAGQLSQQIDQALDKVASLDADRALRRIARLVEAIVRTNFYQRDAAGGLKPYISFKIDSRALLDLPDPKPYREIWVWSPEVEGVHLRFGPVARGGLRWSDRRDDFRAEVLDLVKAQQVKNAIIVPVGAKGGFYPKRLPGREDRAGFAAAGQSAYRTFLRALLDITDNLEGEAVRTPKDVVRWDGDDPYLVVAADKGTATFSDIANGISAEYGHWLGDAFASGGSVGYDHKAMGITAKGAWEAVKRHFREMGRDTQTEPFTVIGVGDMSGDVFGNGMLLSKQIRLLAAFDHRDIFIDPNPGDPALAWAERKRLFDLPASRWSDYAPGLISKGGGVFSRADKAIMLTPEIKALTGLTAAYASPAEIMHALLQSECDLLWFGGIGTFVKAARESHAEASDKTNDSVRVDAECLRCKVIGEGANLGVTQAGRIAFARAGGRINTDAVDNSAGVDTSDHEVNIKILLAEAERQGALPAAERNGLLAAMTDEVGALVLADNYNQTLALTLAEATAASDLDAYERFMGRLEAAGKLNRKVEGLPAAEEIRALRDQSRGLTRPELAKLIAYAKIDLFDALVASDTPDDPHFEAQLKAYFPTALSRFEAAMAGHRLRREIIATGLAGALVDMAGPLFAHRISETTRAAPAAIARAAEAARRIFDLDGLRARINALDLTLPAALQTELQLELAVALNRHTAYLVRLGRTEPLGALIARYAPAVAEQRAVARAALTEAERAYLTAREQRLLERGAPADIAHDVTILPALSASLDIADVSAARGVPASDAFRLYRAVAAALGVDRMRIAAAGLRLREHWDRLSLRRLLEELSETLRRLTAAAAEHAGAGPLTTQSAADAAERWISALGPDGDRVRGVMRELDAAGGWTFAKVVLAASELNALVERG